jgi:hypothetical protein
MGSTRTLVLSTESYLRIQQFASFVGIPVDRAASEAIEKWMNDTGDVLVGELKRRQRVEAMKPRLTLLRGGRQAQA